MNIPLILVNLVVFGTRGIVSQNDEYETCRQPFECGVLRDIPYPFYGGDRPVSCGSPGYEISCQDNIPRINTSEIIYRVLDICNQTQTLVVARDDLWDDVCALQLSNISVDTAFYNFYTAANDQQFTLLYGCTGGIQIQTLFSSLATTTD
ncbi:LEAF RUST 10 DISEASE-RESISTANCE LOCUS RECEPTOR-LIKE PROTEIN KINASE-like 1.2 [Salvia divinorum]|uniref:LEAF RUST 10 DISEASE-RESISTANCE LOCUS RECEPTOR-LIKE PROTEIN KINASE-like 1.2 n=1 Tax=Salvia divinorum TaxID=28513 RepID=A0ABD1FY85_SALDI